MWLNRSWRRAAMALRAASHHITRKMQAQRRRELQASMARAPCATTPATILVADGCWSMAIFIRKGTARLLAV